jgi:hypothetical protein
VGENEADDVWHDVPVLHLLGFLSPLAMSSQGLIFIISLHFLKKGTIFRIGVPRIAVCAGEAVAWEWA